MLGCEFEGPKVSAHWQVTAEQEELSEAARAAGNGGWAARVAFLFR